MARKSLTAVVGLAGVLCGAVAWACGGDWGYQNQWQPDAGVAMLSPANDTRTNFVLLMADRFGTRVADPRKVNETIVPIEMSYNTFVGRIFPAADTAATGTADDSDDQGLSVGSDYERSSGNLGLCHSNRAGAAAFVAAVSADRAVPADEKKLLIDARGEIAKACDQAGATALALEPVRSPAGRGYGQYLEGARLFYAEAFAQAVTSFDAAAKSSSPWARETATYMRFRNTLASAVAASADKYGDLAKPAERAQQAIDQADVERRAYLTAYPAGRYATSASGLARRIAWLKGDEAALGGAYSAMISVKPGDGLPDLHTMTEIDRRILPSNDGAGVTDPALLAIVDLMRLRPTHEYDEERECCGATLSRAELEHQRPYFRNQTELFDYLLGVEAFYNRKKPREVLALIPDAAHQARFNYVQFSRQMLRGLALEAVKDANARAFWLSLLPGAVQPYQRGAVELAIYQHDRAAGVVGRLLETGSPILHPLIRSRIIEIDATPVDLRRMVKAGKTQHERQTALYMLLGNELRYGMYKPFLADQLLTTEFPSAPAGEGTNGSWSTENYDPEYGEWPGRVPVEQFALNVGVTRGCPMLRATVTALSTNSAAVRPLLCLAEFIRNNGFDNWDEYYIPEKGKYGLNPRPAYGSQALTRAQIYHLVMNNPVASDDDKAFALNRAVRCYQPSGNNSCGGADVPRATRKAWFQRLKARYPGSSWAKELKYYW